MNTNQLNQNQFSLNNKEDILSLQQKSPEELVEERDPLFEESHEATYCPEDDKLRLYIGRVPREQYLALRKEGWTSTPKQNCDFVAVWTARREDTALKYAGFIGDEDQSPTDRAADRAERFSRYRDKRRGEALEYADNYEKMPLAHGHQSEQKANREARKHDRIGTKAVSQWEKAEYWQHRTAGVISNALYKSSPGLRMGRIKKLESELRAEKKRRDEYNLMREAWVKTSKIEDTEKQFKFINYLAGASYARYKTKETLSSENKYIRENGARINELLNDLKLDPSRVIEIYLNTNPDRTGFKSRYQKHLELRLAYENQMLEAAGGLAGELDIKIGGTIGGKIVFKVNKSRQSGRVVSVDLLGPKVERNAYQVSKNGDSKYSIYNYKTERMDKSFYKEPTEEGLKIVEEEKAFLKANKKESIPLINLSTEDAQTLQNIWNQKEREIYVRNYGEELAEKHFKPSEIVTMTQAEFSAGSKGSYSPYKTKFIGKDGHPTYKQYYGNVSDGAILKIRYCASNTLGAYRVIVITDKPSKKLPELQTEKVEA